MHLLIRRCGTLIDISPDGRSPLPPPIIELLQPALIYQYKRILRGAESFDHATGRRQNVAIEDREMYTIDSGRLTTGYGFTPRLVRILQAAGHLVHLVDVSPARVRPECYTPDWNLVQQHITFRPRQAECLAAIASSPGGLIDAPTGFGKTMLIAAASLLFPRAKIAVIVKPRDVAARIVRQLSRHVPNVGLVGDAKKYISRVTVYTADSMHHCDGDVDFLFADEVHQLMSPKHADELGQVFRHSRNFAFSATPTGRMDGGHARIECFFGPTIFKMTYQEAVELGLVVPLRVRWLPIDLQHNPAKDKSGVPQMRWGIWRNQERNALIANDILTNYNQDSQILVAVATIEHAVHLWQFLPQFHLCYGASDGKELDLYKKSRMLPQNFSFMTQERRDGMRSAFEAGTLRHVIATDVWSTGVDFERLQVLYRADARESEVLDAQWPGRACRLYEGKEYGEIVDCIDQFDKGLLRKSRTRRKHYDNFGWSQHWPQGKRQISHVF